MHRVPEVIDCWYDSGAMPFAQWGYPHQGKEKFESQFRLTSSAKLSTKLADGFYSQLAISTMLFGDQASETHKTNSYPHPFKNCIVLGLMLSEWWQTKKKHLPDARRSEVSADIKQRKPLERCRKAFATTAPPQEIFDQYGADALRWYFFAKQPPWTSIQYSERQIKESIPRIPAATLECL